MNVYQTDDDGYFIGTVAAADPDPLTPGNWLIPRGCVGTAPPALGANETAHWAGGAWTKRPDLRGRVYWLADGSRHEIVERGVALPDGALDAEPTKPLPDLQAAARSKIIAARNAEITGGFTYLGKPIDSDRDSVMSITGAGVAALAAKAAGLPYSVTWTCADDSTIVLDADGVLGMVVALAMFADAQHAKARPLKDAIKNAKTPDDVGKVVWYNRLL